MKKGDKAGKLECWRRMPVQPVSAMRGDREAIARAESGERDLETGAKIRQRKKCRRSRSRQREGNGWWCRQIKGACKERRVSVIDGERGETKTLKWVGVSET